jgi:cyanosortase A-associated protein
MLAMAHLFFQRSQLLSFVSLINFMQIDRFRVTLISALTVGTIAVLIKSNFFPTPPKITQFEIPKGLALPNWTLKSSQILYAAQQTFQSGRQYQYRQGKDTIDIEIRHLVNTEGSIKDYLKVYKSVDLHSPDIRQNNGFYGIFTHQNRTYLSACVNPRGESTFSGTQFARNRNLQDIRLDRILPWLLGSESLRDDRCLWVELSVANGDRELLENVWFQLYPTLRNRFQQ